MQIPKEQILEFLRSRGDDAKAERAGNDLPEQVDTDRDSGLLQQLGIDPSQLLGLLGGGGGGGLGGLLGGR